MTTTRHRRRDELCIRWERSVGLDTHRFGIWRDGRHTEVSADLAALLLQEHGMTAEGADALLGIVADEDAAFSVRNGTTELL